MTPEENLQGVADYDRYRVRRTAVPVWAGIFVIVGMFLVFLAVFTCVVSQPSSRSGGHYVLGPNYDIRYDGCWHAADSYTAIPGGVTYTRGDRESTWYGPYGVEERR